MITCRQQEPSQANHNHSPLRLRVGRMPIVVVQLAAPAQQCAQHQPINITGDVLVPTQAQMVLGFRV